MSPARYPKSWLVDGEAEIVASTLDVVNVKRKPEATTEATTATELIRVANGEDLDVERLPWATQTINQDGAENCLE